MRTAVPRPPSSLMFLALVGLALIGPLAPRPPSDVVATSSQAVQQADSGRCGDSGFRDVPGLRLPPLLDTLRQAGVEDPGEFEPPHGLPFRILWGGFGGDELIATAVRPGSRLFHDGSRLVRTFRVDGTRVRERVACSRPRTHSLVFVADGVHWSTTGPGRRELETLIRRIAAQ